MSRKKVIAALLMIVGIGLVILIQQSASNTLMFPSTITVGPQNQEEMSLGKEEESLKSSTKDYSLYEPKMFVGKWIRKDVEDKDTLNLPIPGKRGGSTKAESMPEEIVFVADTFTDPEDPSYSILNDLSADDYFEMRASFKITPLKDKKKDDKKENSNLLNLFGVYDISGSELTMGMIGLDPEENIDNLTRHEEKVTEIHYKIDWKGSVLKLSYKDSSAIYYPSSYEAYPELVPEKIFSLGQSLNPDMDFYTFELTEKDCGMISDPYGDDIPVKYTISDDGSFQIIQEDGKSWNYKEYLRSDNNLILRKKEKNLIYMSDVWYPFERYNKKMAFEFTSELILNGADIFNCIGHDIKDLTEYGFITSVDIEAAVDPGKITEAFTVRYNGIDLEVKVCNISDIPIPLKNCYICWINMDLAGQDIGVTQGALFSGQKNRTFCAGDKMDDILNEYDNLKKINKNNIYTTFNLTAGYYESTIADLGGTIIADPMGIAVLGLDFKDDELASCTIYAPDNYLNDMHYNMNDKDLAKADPVKIRALGDIKPNIVSILEKSFVKHFGDRMSCTEPGEYGHVSSDTDWNIQDLDFYRPSGTILIPWTHLFKHGKAALSEKGKKLLDEVYSCLSESNKNQDFQNNVSAINICSYMDLLDKETSEEITKSRAEAVSNYLKEKSSQNLQKQLPAFKTKAYGITGFLSVKEKEGHNGPFIEIRCILSPKKNLDLEDKKLEKYAEQPVSYLPESTGHNYMSPDQNNYNKDAEAFALQYTPVYRKKTCSIPNLDLKWKLPDKWHFASDAELKALNNGSASDLLNEQKSLYVMAAYSKDYRSMAHIRLYPEKTIDGNDDSAKKEAIQALHNSILVNLEEYAQDIKDELKTEKSEDGDDFISVFNYKDGENEHKRTVHYIIKDGTLALLTEIR